MDILNNFSQLSAECDVDRLAQLTPEEMQEANNYYDQLQVKWQDTQFEPKIHILTQRDNRRLTFL